MSEQPGDGLAGVDLDALFAGDLEPERVDFRVAGRECWVELLPMDASAAARFAALSAKLFDATGAIRGDVTEEALAAWQLHLVQRTLVGWCLWRRTRLKGGALGDWQQDVAPETDRDRLRVIEGMRARPEFWQRLVAECLRVNALTGDAQGN